MDTKYQLKLVSQVVRKAFPGAGLKIPRPKLAPFLQVLAKLARNESGAASLFKAGVYEKVLEKLDDKRTGIRTKAEYMKLLAGMAVTVGGQTAFARYTTLENKTIEWLNSPKLKNPEMITNVSVFLANLSFSNEFKLRFASNLELFNIILSNFILEAHENLKLCLSGVTTVWNIAFTNQKAISRLKPKKEALILLARRYQKHVSKRKDCQLLPKVVKRIEKLLGLL